MTVKFPVSIKLLSVLLSIAILAVSLPLSVFSIESDSEPEASLSLADGSVQETEESEEYELIQYRDAFSKQYKQSDGTVRVVQYADSIHYLDATGTWQDIDNALTLSGTSFSTSDGRVSFSKETNRQDPLLTLRQSGYSVRVSLRENSNLSSAEVSPIQKTDSQQTAVPALQPSEIRYADLLGHTDFVYSVTGSCVKETILVKEPGVAYAYTFALDLDGLEAEMTAGGSVFLYDQDAEEIIYFIPAGFMEDADGETSDLVRYTLIQNETGKYELTVTADAGWINDPDRSFPVSIDPSFYVSPSSVVDLYVSEALPNSSFSSSTSVIVSQSAGHARIGYWKTTNLPILPDSAYITDARLSLYSESGSGYYVGVYAVLSDWDNTLTWNKTLFSVPEGELSSELLDYNCLDGSPADGRYSFNLTGLVRSWYDGTAANYGVGLGFVPGPGATGSVSFRSMEYQTTSCRPQFVIVYQDMKGIESYWSYSEHDVGLAGTGYINHATGSLALVKPLLSTTDYLFPYTPTLTYHSSMAGKAWAYPDAETSFGTSNTAYGFKLNIAETVVKKWYYNQSGTYTAYYVWSDADGTEHSFYPSAEDASVYEDEDGLQLKLTIGTGNCTLSDDSKTVKTFSKMSTTPGTDVGEAYFLYSIRDRNQNQVSFAFGSNYRPVSVKLTPYNGSAITFLTLSYESSSGLPYLIWNQTTKEAIVFRYSATPTGSISTTAPHYLRELIYAHGNSAVTAANWLSFYSGSGTTNITIDGTASYSYDADGYLVSCKDHLSDYEIRYTWSNGKVSTAREYGQTSLPGQQIGFCYFDGYTEVRNSGADDVYGTSDDLVTRYGFDREGRTVSVYATDAGKTQIFGAGTCEFEESDKVHNNLKRTTTVGGSPSNYLLNGGFELTNSGSDACYWTETSNVCFYYTSAEEDGGEHRAYFTVQSGTTDSVLQNVRLPVGTYTLSMIISTYRCENVSAQVRARSLSDSAHDYSAEIPLNDYYAAGAAQPFSLTFDAAGESGGYEDFEISILVTGGSVGSPGSASVGIDNVMLEKSIGYVRYSMVEMGNFEMASLNAAGTAYEEHGTDFWKDQTNSLVRTAAGDPFGCAGQVSGSITQERYIRQRVYTAPTYVLYEYDDLFVTTPVSTYLVSGFAKGTGQVDSPHSVFGLRVDITYYNGSGHDDEVVSTTFRFQNGCADWQFVSGSVDTEEYRCVKSIDVLCVFSYQPGGYALFDNISFSLNNDDSVVKYTYYADGETNGLLHVKESGWYTEAYEYNEDRQLVRLANNRGELHDYTYAANGVDVSTETYYTFTPKNYPYLSTDPDSYITKTPKLRTNYTYNTYGQLTDTSSCEVEYDAGGNVVNRAGTEFVTASRQYETFSGSRIFGALKLETDSLGRVTRYYYDSQKGLLLATVNVSDGTGTCFVYDAIGNLESVYPCSYVSASSYQTNLTDESVDCFYDGHNRLQSIETESTAYWFTYDSFGNRTKTEIGNRTLAQYNYQSQNGKLSTVTYGNGFRVRYVYDELDRISEIWHKQGSDTEVKAYAYTYTAQGQLHRVDDLLTGRSTTYKYNASGKLVNVTVSDSSDDRVAFGENLFYNENGQPSSVFLHEDYTFDSTSKAQWTVQYFHAYKSDGKLNYYNVSTETTTGRIDYSYDAFGRSCAQTYSYHLKSDSSQSFTNTVEVTFESNGSNTSAQIDSYSSQVGNNTAVTWTYTYDANGNITTATDSNGVEYRYQYDKLGQLVREDNTEKNRTYVYTYDDAGNILCRYTYYLTAQNATPTILLDTKIYSYQDAYWGDLLTGYDGITITYDTIGNPLSYYNGSSYTFTWGEGRHLKTAAKGSYSLSFQYNDEGLRVSKTVNGVEHRYTLSGTQIVSEEWGNNLCIYLYDESGSPIGMQYRSASMAEGVFYTFWFEKNLQGDIVAIYNNSGVKVFSYTYDAWGNTIKSWINSSGTNYYATYNSFTYRGYYYDSELGLYYLQSRYYDPVIGRFINADGQLNKGLLGCNAYAYCSSNPVNRIDTTGDMATEAVAAVANCWNPLGWILIAVVAVEIVAVVVLINQNEDRIDETAEKIKDAVSAIEEKITAENQSVYVLQDPSDGLVKYVGRTNCPDRRLSEHKRDPLHPERSSYRMTVVATGLTVVKARILEQVLISTYQIDYLENSRREIARGNLYKCKQYLSAINQIIIGIPEDELMNLMGR